MTDHDSVTTDRDTARRTADESGHQHADRDVVDLIRDQHAFIRGVFTRVETVGAAQRPTAFADLRRLLAVHETVEELVVHPAVRMAGGEANDVVDARLAEEHEAKQMLAEIDRLDPAAADFLPRLAGLRDRVLAHAEAEEAEELPLLRAHLPAQRLRAMAVAARAVERVAPTRPHPGVESMTANLVAGPAASFVDRARDAVEAVLGRGR